MDNMLDCGIYITQGLVPSIETSNVIHAHLHRVFVCRPI